MHKKIQSIRGKKLEITCEVLIDIYLLSLLHIHICRDKNIDIKVGFTKIETKKESNVNFH